MTNETRGKRVRHFNLQRPDPEMVGCVESKRELSVKDCKVSKISGDSMHLFLLVENNLSFDAQNYTSRNPMGKDHCNRQLCLHSKEP